MRRGIMLGIGLAGTLAASATASAQFAADRPPASPPPAAPAPQPPAGSEPRAEHPWLVKPEHGAWMICVKSYRGENSRQLAEELAQEVRRTHNAAAYLFEWGAEERQKEEQRRADLIRQKAQQYAPFLREQQRLQAEMKAKAAAEGTEFVPTPVTIRVPKFEFTEQWAVLVGGFKDMDTARKALDTVRTWQPPKNTRLMDTLVAGNAKVGADGTYINPFASAMVFPNPAIRRSAPDQAPPVDPALAKLNEEEPLSLLKTRKPWTLMVKGFTVPSRVQDRREDGGILGRLFSGNEAAEQLETTAKQARLLADRLRSAEMQQSVQLVAPTLGLTPQPVESFILHIRNGSIVTVGQYDSEQDPALLEMQRLLQGITFDVEYKDGRPRETRRMFDLVSPMRVPRPQ